MSDIKTGNFCIQTKCCTLPPKTAFYQQETRSSPILCCPGMSTSHYSNSKDATSVSYYARAGAGEHLGVKEHWLRYMWKTGSLDRSTPNCTSCRDPSVSVAQEEPLPLPRPQPDLPSSFTPAFSCPKMPLQSNGDIYCWLLSDGIPLTWRPSTDWHGQHCQWCMSPAGSKVPFWNPAAVLRSSTGSRLHRTMRSF